MRHSGSELISHLPFRHDVTSGHLRLCFSLHTARLELSLRLPTLQNIQCMRGYRRMPLDCCTFCVLTIPMHMISRSARVAHTVKHEVLQHACRGHCTNSRKRTLRSCGTSDACRRLSTNAAVTTITNATTDATSAPVSTPWHSPFL